MSNCKLFLFLLSIFLCANSVINIPVEAQKKQILLVFSYDAFSNDYFQRNESKYMQEFRKEGVYAPYVKPIFPTKTFTNHFAMATGLYSEWHGVTANEVYDLDRGMLKYSYDLFHYNKAVLPIWTLNEMNGGTSGCMMWPGSNFEYSNVTCTHAVAYNSSVPMKTRVDTVMSWITDPKKPANFIMFYLEQPDKAAHAYGPKSAQAYKYVQLVSELTEYVQQKLREHDLVDRANVIHLSDHGMVGVKRAKMIDLRQFLANGTYNMYGTSPVLQVVPVEGKHEEVYTRLKNAAVDNGHFNVYTKDNLPERWHCKNEKRIGPIVAVADLEYGFQDLIEAIDYYKEKNNVTFSPENEYGVHGYDNELPAMRAYFMAKGPAFKQKHVVEPFNNIDLFNLFTKILDIKNSPRTNGTFENVADILKSSTSMGGMSSWLIGIVAAFCIFAVVAIAAVMFYKRSKSINISGQEDQPMRITFSK